MPTQIAGLDDLVTEVNESLSAQGVKATKTLIKNVLQEAFANIETLAEAGTAVRIRGFGSFSIKERAARQGRNPQTGETIEIAATSHLHFKQSKSAK